MPPHTHMRRSEVYFYFDVDPAHRALGIPDRGLRMLRVICGGDKGSCGVSGVVDSCRAWNVELWFRRGMGGENQAYDDMDGVAIAELK